MKNASKAEIPTNDFLTPDNIGHLIDNDLNQIRFGMNSEYIPTGATQGNTNLFIINGRPDLVLRSNPGEGDLDDMKVAAEAYKDLRDRGLNVLPYEIVEHKGDLYILTQKVEGITLDEAMSTMPAETIAEEIDATWERITHYASDSHKQGGVAVYDMISANQYMYGRVSGDTQDKVWLVDLDVELHDAYTSTYDYWESIMDISKYVAQMEHSLGVALPRSRNTLEALLVDDRPKVGAYMKAARMCLGEAVDFVDDDYLDLEGERDCLPFSESQRSRADQVIKQYYRDSPL